MAMAAKGDHLAVLLGVIVATVVSFLIASVILKTSKSDKEDLSQATSKMEEMKGKKSSVSSTLTQESNAKPADEVNKVIFACDAGMGSSAMGASLLKDKFKKAGIEGIEVTNKAINDLPNDVDIVITHKDLTDRAKAKVPNAQHISVDNFLNSPKYQELIDHLKDN